MAHTLTVEQADEVVRILGFDGMVDDSGFGGSFTGSFHHYFLEDGTIIEIGDDCQLQHQRLVEDPADGLVPQNMLDIEDIMGPDVGVVELRREGVMKGFIDLANVDAMSPEQRHIHDLRVLDLTERMLRFTQSIKL